MLRIDPLPPVWPSPYPLVRSLVTSEVRGLEQAALERGLTALVLMEHAARCVAALAASLTPAPGSRVLVLAGPGNNGGDGYGAARHLSAWGFEVCVLTRGGPPPRAGEAGLEAALARAELPVIDLVREPGRLSFELARSDLVVDALFGIGLERPLAAAWLEVIDAVNAAARRVLAVDLPSGLESDSGRPLPRCVRADVTASMVAPKRGIAPGAPGAAYAGQVVAVDIGLPRSLLAPYLVGR